jgi:hypothetical protein
VSEGYSGGRIVHKGRLATVICGDAREVLAGMEKETVDLVVVDPPYGMEFVSRKRTESFGMLAGDGVDRVGVHEIIEGCVRVVGQDRHLYVFGPADVLDGLKVSEPAPMVWDKVVNGMGQGPWAPAHEPINFAVSRHRHAGKAGKSNRPVRLRKGSVCCVFSGRRAGTCGIRRRSRWGCCASSSSRHRAPASSCSIRAPARGRRASRR